MPFTSCASLSEYISTNVTVCSQLLWMESWWNYLVCPDGVGSAVQAEKYLDRGHKIWTKLLQVRHLGVKLLLFHISDVN